MKTYEQLMKHYWGETVPMAEAAGIDPWLCVRHLTGIFGSDKVYFKQEYTDHPDFKLPEDKSGYTFALTVLEKRPVFVGDKLYRKTDGCEITVTVSEIDKLILSKWTLTPPTNKRTFMLELDEEEIEHLIWLTGNIKAFKSGLMYKRLTELRSNQNAM